MFKKPHKNNLIRLHPKCGGVLINHGKQCFQGVSTDLFFGLDLNDFSRPYHITRKFNISIAVNPKLFSTDEFLAHLTAGNLEKTDKCHFHGDKATKLSANTPLLNMLDPSEFTINSVRYRYDSIGVACNPSYASVSQRQGNDFQNSTSHFEIKFQRQPVDGLPEEYICLNIHLMQENTKQFGQLETIERLKQGINLFYAELGLCKTVPAHIPYTNLKSALTVTLDNYEARDFSCQHEASRAVLSEYQLAKQRTLVKEKEAIPNKPAALGFFSLAPTDFPSLTEVATSKLKTHTSKAFPR